jgi:hypothetical protein
MPTYFVASGGSNTSPYDTWAKAATSLQTALTAANTAGDVVVIQYDAVPTTDGAMSVDTTYTCATTGLTLVAASNDGGSAYTPTEMGTSNWIGSSSLSVQITFIPSDTTFWGLTIRNGGSTSKDLRLSQNTDCRATWINSLFWLGTTNTSPRIMINENGTQENKAIFKECSFVFGSASQLINCESYIWFEDCEFAKTGTVPTTLISQTMTNGKLIDAEFSGCDISAITDTLVGNTTRAQFNVIFRRCTLGSGVIPLAAQSGNSNVGSQVLILDSDIGTTLMKMAYYDHLGQCTTVAGTKYTGTPADCSFEVVTSSLCRRSRPFRTPWIDYWFDATASVTPWIEVLRKDSTSARTDAEVWAEWDAKVTSGSARSSFFDDRQADAGFISGAGGTNQATGAGTSAWTNAGGTAWSGKCDTGAAITTTEDGTLRGRIAVGVASATIYVDPLIRT